MPASDHLSPRQFPKREVPGPLYHGTTDIAGAAIEEGGFVPSASERHGAVFFTPSEEVAQRYADAKAQHYGGNPAVYAIDGLQGVSHHDVTSRMDHREAAAMGAQFTDKGVEVLVHDPSIIVGKPRRTR